MNRKAFLAAIAFLGALALFSLSAPSPFSLPLVSPAYAAPQPAPRQQQDSAPEFPSTETGVRTVDENTDPYTPIGAPVTATSSDITYSLENAGNSDFGIDYFSGQLLVGNRLDYEEQSSHEVTVVARNSSGTARQAVTIDVTNVDEDGTVSFSWVADPQENETVFTANLQEPDGTSGMTTWKWERSNNQNSGYEGNTVAESATYTAPSTRDFKYLKATAEYTDAAFGSGKTVSQTVTVEINSRFHGKPLTFNGGDNDGYTGGYDCDDADAKTICVNIPRNSAPGSSLYYPRSIYYGDGGYNDYPPHGTISYSLSRTDAVKFDIVPSTGELRTKDAHSYGSPGNDGHFDITITATDTSGENDSVTIELEPSGPDKYLTVVGPSEIRYPENGTWQLARYTGSAVYPNEDPDDTHGWIIGVQPGGGDGDFFDIDDNGVLSFTQPPDYEDGKNHYSFSIHAYDSNPPGGNRPAQTFYSVTVIISNVDEDLEIRGPTSVRHQENDTGPVATYTAEGAEGSLEWTLSGQDSNLFAINGDGELTFEQTPDYENPFDASDPVDDRNDYLLSVTVTDGTDTKSRDPVRVMVTNVNEAPVFPSEATTITISEDTLSGTDIGTPILADDPDVGDSPQYSPQRHRCHVLHPWRLFGSVANRGGSRLQQQAELHRCRDRHRRRRSDRYHHGDHRNNRC